MTALEGKSESRGFFSIYKKGQGKWVRWGTVGAMGLAIAVGAVWLIEEPYLATRDPLLITGVAVLWVLVWAALTFWMVNSPKMAEFLIMTESEMRKVTWPARAEVINSTKVIILITLLLGVLLWLVDLGFVQLFHLIGLS